MTERALLLDEMLSGAIAEQLRARNHDVLAVVDDSTLVGQSDADLLEYASATGRCLVTLNIADFAVLSAQWASSERVHGGILYVPSRTFPQSRALNGSIVTSVHAALVDGTVPAPGADGFLTRRDS